MLGTKFSRMLGVSRFVLIDVATWVLRFKNASQSLRFPALVILLLLTPVCLPLLAQCTLDGQEQQESSLSQRVPPMGFPVSENFQALIDHTPGTWPQVPVHTMRLWDSGTAWFQMKKSPGDAGSARMLENSNLRSLSFGVP